MSKKSYASRPLSECDNYNVSFDKQQWNNRFDDRRRSFYGSGYFDSCLGISRASSTESLLDDISLRAATLFHSLDPQQRGFINKEDLFSLSCDFDEEELLDVFNQLDQDKDGTINVEDFKAGLKLINTKIYKKNSDRRRSRVNSLSGWSPPLEHDTKSTKPRLSTHGRSLDEAFTVFSCEEKICDFYETVSSKHPEIAETFNDIIEIIINDVKDMNKERCMMNQCFAREKHLYEERMRKLEDECEAQIQEILNKENKQEHEKMEKEFKELLQKKDNEINKLKDILQETKSAKCTTTAEITQQLAELKEKINRLERENNSLQVQLSMSQTECAMIRSEQVTMKQIFNERIVQLQREKNNLSLFEKDWNNMTKQLMQLREVNRKLQDTNDSLRSAIETSNSAKEIIRKISCVSAPIVCPAEERNLLLCDPVYAKSQIINKKRDKTDSGTRDSLFDDHIDSGLSTLRDVAELESEIHPINLFTEAHARVSKVDGCYNQIDSDDVFLEHTKSADLTMVSRPNSLQTSRSNENLLKPDIDDVSTESVRSPRKKTKLRERRRNYYRERSLNKETDDDGDLTERNKSHNVKVNSTRAMMPERIFKIVFAGDASVGKSTFLMRLCTNSFIQETMATIGIDFRNKTIEVDGQNIGLQLWDTAGQEKYRSITANYFRKADGVLLLYDCTYEESFIHVRDWVETIRSAAGDDIPIVLASNKSDLRERYEQENRRVVSRELGLHFSKEKNLLFVETSARSGQNIEETVIELARVLLKNEDNTVSKTHVDLTKGNENKTQQTKSPCCK